ncbi:addiction module antidote protein, HigA family [Sphingomonas sp. NFR04]|uniref:HigA family addiction module antitoxin n=1 Tax=Sphingomonas sp. NFR04 TaxID=1566283 RepID=UPI0008E87A06|nr:HigA family addiction module antitoxin [Sphingomonas sp. NFR04]SFK37307.1 addiction module antidote protein, HigA family [Sphingomonas sp. NFR04]
MAHTDNTMPPKPGDVLRKRVLGDMDITQDQLAEALGVSRHSVNQLLNSRRAVTPEMALRLERVLDTSADMWLNLQAQVDLHDARQKIGDDLSKLPALRKSESSKTAG